MSDVLAADPGIVAAVMAALWLRYGWAGSVILPGSFRCIAGRCSVGIAAAAAGSGDLGGDSFRIGYLVRIA